MIDSRMRIAHVAIIALLALVPAVAAAGTAIPPDFSLRAEYYPPLGDADRPPSRGAYPWTMVLNADGRAYQESNRTVPSRRTIVQRSVTVSRQGLQALVADVRRANFQALAPEYGFEIAPHAVLVLRITLDGHTHDVTVYGPERLKDDAGVATFMRVWARTVALAPPPPGEWGEKRGQKKPGAESRPRVRRLTTTPPGPSPR
jgi:hypothetical protein